MDLSPAAATAARSIFLREDLDHPPCNDCGGVHMRACPRIKSLHTIVNDRGVVVDRQVEYWPPGTWEEGVLFFDDLAD